ACDDDTAWVWDASTGQSVGHALRPQNSVSALAVGQAGGNDVIATADYTGSGHQIRIWDPGTGTQLGDPLPCTSGKPALAMGRIGNQHVIAAAAEDGVTVWDMM